MPQNQKRTSKKKERRIGLGAPGKKLGTMQESTNVRRPEEGKGRKRRTWSLSEKEDAGSEGFVA